MIKINTCCGRRGSFPKLSLIAIFMLYRDFLETTIVDRNMALYFDKNAVFLTVNAH